MNIPHVVVIIIIEMVSTLVAFFCPILSYEVLKLIKHDLLEALHLRVKLMRG